MENSFSLLNGTVLLTIGKMLRIGKKNINQLDALYTY